MAGIPFNNNINLKGNQVLGRRIENLASAPGSPSEGLEYHDTGTHSPYFWNGTSWIPYDAQKRTGIPIGNLDTDPLARANHTGTQLASTISNFQAVVNATSLSSFAAPTGDIGWNSKKITSLADPTSAQDAATKAYVDAQVQTAATGIDPKESVKAATTANITLSGTQTIDGITLAVGDRVLVKNQTTSADNGLYLVASGAWTRTADGAQGKLTSGALVLVVAGTTNAASQWFLQTADPITVGTTAQTWIQFSATAAYTAGNGITITGSVIAVKLPANSGLVADGTGLYVDTSSVVRKYTTTIGDSSNTSFTVTHNLGTLDVTMSIRNITTGELELADVTATGINTINVVFSSAPPTNSYRVVVHG